MIILAVLVVIIGGIFLGGYVYRSISGKCRCRARLDGKVVLITGASAGIGQYTALDLARRGAKLILGCRNRIKAQAVADWIIEETGNKNVAIYDLDLSDFESIRDFAKEVSALKRIDILINNAGGASSVYRKSAQDYELTCATNYLGHFLLTHLLLKLLRNASSARIINVSSTMHTFAKLDLTDLHCRRRKYTFWRAYAESKLANILFTTELDRRLKESNITVFALHPGTVSTEIATKEGTLLGKVITKFIGVVGKTAEGGAQTSIHLAVAKDVEIHSGKYFIDCKVAATSKDADDESLARSLWTISESQVQLKEEERILLSH